MEENRDKLLSDGLLIAGVPLLGYAIAFAYESGYGLYYGIPLQLISLTLTQILVAIAGLISIIILLFSVSYLGYAHFYSEKEPSPVGAALWRQTPVFFLCLAMLASFGPRWPEWGIALGATTFSVFWEFILPLLTHREKTTYREKLLASEAAQQSIPNPLRLAVKSYGPAALRLYNYGLVVFLLLLIAHWAGRGEALRETSYLTDSTSNKVVILRFCGDMVVAREYDSSTNKLKGDFIVTKISSKQPLRFEKKLLGHLEKSSP
jgi:hypothetical protein